MQDFGSTTREPMLDMFIFESNQMLEQLEEILLNAEKVQTLKKENVNEIFRIMHTIKGSSAMMMFAPISTLAHNVEDLFFHIRDNMNDTYDFPSICDIVLKASDALKNKIQLIEEGETVLSDDAELKEEIKAFLLEIKQNSGADLTETVRESTQPAQFYISQYDKKESSTAQKYSSLIHFDEGCEMENIRAYSLVFSLQEQCQEMYHIPNDLVGDSDATDYIVKNGFQLWFSSELPENELSEILNGALFVSQIEFAQIAEFPPEAFPEPIVQEVLTKKKPSIQMPNRQKDGEVESGIEDNDSEEYSNNLEDLSADRTKEISTMNAGIRENKDGTTKSSKSNIINVNVQKLDMLLDLVGEIVITESMVTRCPELAGLQLDVFHKSANQLRKLTDELQDVVMSIRMLPIANTFQKMHRIVRDMSKQLNKEAELILLGEETEVDKNLIDQLADPLMHLVRNSMDHGLEANADRKAVGKSEKGKITLEAKNDGGEIWITVSDDGKGLDKERILGKAREHGLTNKTEDELTEKEIFGFILLPGFSTKEKVSEFSGRGVGMDVVRENITQMGGSISIESVRGKGTTMTIRIPLTLAIIDGMQVSVGESGYIIPTMAIRESLRAEKSQAIKDNDGNELIMIRGECFPMVRLHKLFNVEPGTKEIEEGIIIVIQHDGISVCLFADELLGEQHVVVKPLPAYFKQIQGISGCTILGDGNISLILDVGSLAD